MAIIGSLPDIPAGCLSEFLMTIPAVAVVSPEHPLAKLAVPVLRSVAEDYVQLVLADRSPLTVAAAMEAFFIMSTLVSYIRINKHSQDPLVKPEPLLCVASKIKRPSR